MKRYLYNASVDGASGSQTFYVDAETREEADTKLKVGGPADIYAADVEVTQLGEFEFDSETTIDDFGDFPPATEKASYIVDDVCLIAAEIFYAKDGDAAQDIINRIRAMLEAI